MTDDEADHDDNYGDIALERMPPEKPPERTSELPLTLLSSLNELATELLTVTPKSSPKSHKIACLCWRGGIEAKLAGRQSIRTGAHSHAQVSIFHGLGSARFYFMIILGCRRLVEASELIQRIIACL